MVAEHAWTLSPAAVNQLRFGYTRRGFNRNSLAIPGTVAGGVGISNIPVTSFSYVLPTFDLVGFQQLGPASSGNSQFTTSVTQLVDDYSGAPRPS